MSIEYNEKSGVFLLSTPASTYVMRLHEGKRRGGKLRMGAEREHGQERPEAGKYLLHCGWHHRLDSWNSVCEMPLLQRGYAPEPDGVDCDESFSLDAVRQEWSAPGGTDFRASAFEVENADGTQSSQLLYRAHRIYKGKKPLEGLPATYVESDDEADTLEIDLADPVTGLTVTNVYTVWNTADVICRHAVYRNEGRPEAAAQGRLEAAEQGGEPITLLGTMSASVDFDGGADMRLLTLSGAHARERHADIRQLVPGMQGGVSRRGMSSHQQNPFMALLTAGATEQTGVVFGMSLVYSGEAEARVEVDQFGTARAQIGIGSHNFRWTLAPSGEDGLRVAEGGVSGGGECASSPSLSPSPSASVDTQHSTISTAFTTPECVMVRSEEGLGGMSRIYHGLYRTRLARGKWRDRERPIVINNWEATYFGFDEEKLLSLAKTAAAEGVECFVLDDGWFGERNDDSRALGDWEVNLKKLPHGLGGLSDEIHKAGMMFGLWVEPEMISPDSGLYRAHPDWCIHQEGRPRSLSRHQLVLDLSRDDVVTYLIETFTRLLSSAKIDYIKWDYNRSPAWLAPGQSHAYMLGLYRLLETLTASFPDVLFESCAGGGGRFDPGMLYYMPQTWTSDNTDALSRVAIQAGTSIVYPASMMSCHVSAVPNHQTGRLSPLQVRGAVAMAGAFGYELDLNKLSPTELEEVKAQIAWYKSIRSIVQFGDLYRLRPVWGAGVCSSLAAAEAHAIVDYAAWEHVAHDKRRAVVTVVWTRAEANAPAVTLHLCGLDSKRAYRFTSISTGSMHRLTNATTQEMLGQSGADAPRSYGIVAEDGTIATGAQLMYAGIAIVCSPQQGGSLQWRLEDTASV